ncbi:IS1-like element transposase [Synechocystis sp. PCC 7509]|uniref:IS1-like element transposase n=1 Tax=Synechocystis sp. PCC 7509 TaxID=927677 RepID=UPI00048DF74D|nr:IS1-like element transposase [Synechocystis sp. PCC 7509]
MALNGSGIRDTARVLHISTSTVIKELKKQTQLQPVDLLMLKQSDCESMVVDICVAKLDLMTIGMESKKR